MDFCKNVVTIPQYKSTCWFNAILMVLLYSQNSRKLLMYNDNFKKRKDNLSIILKEILYHHYINHDNVGKYFNVLRPENILALCNIPLNIYHTMVENGWAFNIFLSKFIEYMNVSCLTLDYINNIFFTGLNEHIDYYINHYNQLDIMANLKNPTDIFFIKLAEKMRNNYNPDYICINLWNTFEVQSNPYLHLFNSFLSIPVFFERLQLNYYRPSYANLYELKDEILYNGYIYKLDSCILSNYDHTKIGIGHAICGITCKNNKYVYNGWIRTTDDKAMGNGNFGKDDLLPCELFPFNWNINDRHNKFCLREDKCKLSLISNSNRNKLCFSFGKADRTIIYVKQHKDYKPSIDMNILSTNEIKQRDEKIFVVTPPPIIKDKTPPVENIFVFTPSPIKKEKTPPIIKEKTPPIKKEKTPPIKKEKTPLIKKEKTPPIIKEKSSPIIKEKSFRLLTDDIDEYKKIANLYNLKISTLLNKIKNIRTEIKKIKFQIKNKNKL